MTKYETFDIDLKFISFDIFHCTRWKTTIAKWMKTRKKNEIISYLFEMWNEIRNSDGWTFSLFSFLKLK